MRPAAGPGRGRVRVHRAALGGRGAAVLAAGLGRPPAGPDAAVPGGDRRVLLERWPSGSPPCWSRRARRGRGGDRVGGVAGRRGAGRRGARPPSCWAPARWSRGTSSTASSPPRRSGASGWPWPGGGGSGGCGSAGWPRPASCAGAALLIKQSAVDSRWSCSSSGRDRRRWRPLLLAVAGTGGALGAAAARCGDRVVGLVVRGRHVPAHRRREPAGGGRWDGVRHVAWHVAPELAGAAVVAVVGLVVLHRRAVAGAVVGALLAVVVLVAS